MLVVAVVVAVVVVAVGLGVLGWLTWRLWGLVRELGQAVARAGGAMADVTEALASVQSPGRDRTDGYPRV